MPADADTYASFTTASPPNQGRLIDTHSAAAQRRFVSTGLTRRYHSAPPSRWRPIDTHSAAAQRRFVSTELTRRYHSVATQPLTFD